jgi:hypothetical protein
MNLLEYFWRSSYQIVMLTPDSPIIDADIREWGSVFFCLCIKKIVFRNV